MTEDDDELDKIVVERKLVKVGIESFAIVPDSFDYAPTGQTVSDMWKDDDAVKRGMVRAVKESWVLILANREGKLGIAIGAEPEAATAAPSSRSKLSHSRPPCPERLRQRCAIGVPPTPGHSTRT